MARLHHFTLNVAVAVVLWGWGFATHRLLDEVLDIGH